MALFRTDSVTLSYSNVEAAKQWWINAFACKVVRAPDDWDNSLPSDVALTLPGDDSPTVLLCDKAEALRAGFDRTNPVVSIVFSDKLTKAHDFVCSHGAVAEPIQDGGDMQFFEVRDTEGNLIQVCKET